MGVVFAPILEGQVDNWKQWTAEIAGARKDDFTDLNRRHGLTRHAAWLTETPDGQAVIAYHEGPGSDDFLQKIAASDHPVDLWFRDKIKAIHGLDLTQPPPGPLPELYIDTGN